MAPIFGEEHHAWTSPTYLFQLFQATPPIYWLLVTQNIIHLKPIDMSTWTGLITFYPVLVLRHLSLFSRRNHCPQNKIPTNCHQHIHRSQIYDSMWCWQDAPICQDYIGTWTSPNMLLHYSTMIMMVILPWPILANPPHAPVVLILNIPLHMWMGWPWSHLVRTNFYLAKHEWSLHKARGLYPGTCASAPLSPFCCLI